MEPEELRIMDELGQRTAGLRKKAGISQQKLAEMMGVSRTTITQIESGKRKVSVDELARFSKIYNLSVDRLLSSKEEPEVIFAEKQEERKTESPVRINVPQRNLEKFKEVLLYILNKVGSKPNIGETVLYKLLYFTDFDFYEKYEEQLIGATYVKNHYGPTPVEFEKIVAEIMDKEIIKVENEYYNYPQRKYLPLRKADLSKLRANEIEVIDKVLDKLSDMNAKQISDYSHDDVPWLTTEDNEIIEYESVFYRTPIYSVRDYE
jgi:transcriptional regulator with XRE-family HTH domain